ncbi:MAG: type VI immunity family protein [Myxococcota bacterium]
MTSDTVGEELLVELDQTVLRGWKDTPQMCFAVSEKLYFRGRQSREARMALLDTAEHFFARHGHEVTHYFSENSGNESPLAGKDAVERYRTALGKGAFDDDDLHFCFFRKDISAFDFGTIAKNRDRFPSTYRQAVRIQTLLEDTEGYIKRVIARCELLQPEQGTVSVNPHRPFGGIRGFHEHYWPFITRYPGLGVPYLVRKAAIARRVVQANWLTVLDDEFITALGGDTSLRALGEKGIVVHRYDGGVVLQASPLPDLGDLDAGRWPEGLGHVYRFIEPVQVREVPRSPMSAMTVPEPLDPFEETLKWLTRFDRMPESI